MKRKQVNLTSQYSESSEIYRNHLVAFLDVLGFRTLVKESATDKIYTYFNVSKRITEFWQRTEIKDQIKFVTFSDSIVLALDTQSLVDSERLKYVREFFLAVSLLQAELALEDIWLRGGISIGELSFDVGKNIVFGPALIQAYDLESRHAKYPRVLVDQNLLGYLNCRTTYQFMVKLNSSVRDDIAKWQSSIIFPWGVGVKEYNSFRRDYPLFIDYLVQFMVTERYAELESIVRNIQTSSNSAPEAYEKLRWVGDYIKVRHKLQINAFPTLDDLAVDSLDRELETF
jgi:hypothetical protein